MKWLLVVCPLTLLAAPNGADVTCARFPDADAVTLDEIERVTYHPDGTYEQTEESWTKLLTEKGRRSESVLVIDYSQRYGEAKLAYVGAVGTNGVEREIDVSRNTHETTDNSGAAANIYDPLDRKITCLVPGLQVGETLHVKTWRKALKPRCENQWADLSVMEWSHPILRSVYEVTAPAALPLKRIAVRHPLGNLTTNVTQLADGSLVHTFVATNSPQAFPEPDMPPLYTQVQNVRVSTAQDWPEVSRWYWNLCAPHLAKTNAAMVAKVREIVGKVKGRGERSTVVGSRDEVKGRGERSTVVGSRDEVKGRGERSTVEAIFKFVSQEVRYMGLTMEDTSPGYAPHDVDVTFNNRYGVCRDKAGLLVAMLCLAGIQAYPVLIHVGAKLDPDVPQPFFNHAIVAVEGGQRSKVKGQTGEINHNCQTSDLGPLTSYILMDPTNENTKDLYPSYLGNNSYLVARPEGDILRTSPVPSPAENAVDVVSSATLADDGSMFFESRLDFAGINDTAYRGVLVKRTPEERTRTFERILKLVASGAELVKCDIAPRDLRDTSVPLTVSLAARFPEMVLRGETRDELTVPSISKTLGLVNWLLEGSTSLDKRRFALQLDTTAQVRERLTVALGGALAEVADLPRSAETAGGYAYRRDFAVTNGVLTMDRSLALAAVEFSPEEYRRLREDIQRVEAAERRNPTFVADRLRGADVRRILDASETTVLADDAWVTTNTLVTEVLTYQGKRETAEMKLPWHPSWKHIDIVYATVSNQDGSVTSVSPAEVNDMDAEWASAAPRYPKGFVRVINLPSVEIGSVVSVQTVVTVTNAPAPFYATMYRDSFEPVDRRVRRVDGQGFDLRPRRLPKEPAQPDGALWRDAVTVTRADWSAVAAKLRALLDGGATFLSRQEGDATFLSHQEENLNTLAQYRDWMARYVKVVGPTLYALPLEQQLTDPAVVLSERYATRLDYVRTLCALLRDAGYEADVVFAADDATDDARLCARVKTEKPNPRAFATALCRVRWREGGWLCFGGEERECFLGTENEYTPIGATGYDGSDYFDPQTGAFGTVRNLAGCDFAAREEERCEIVVRENGAVDLSVENLLYGAGVGGYRKQFAELLPENRSRLYQTLLGKIAQAATATSDLVTDTEAYPTATRFACFIPDYAVVNGDTITIELPEFEEVLPNLTGMVRETPVALAAAEPKVEEVMVKFPAGYTAIEHIPSAFAFDGERVTVATNVVDGVLAVTIRRETGIVRDRMLAADYAELIKSRRRASSAKGARTITAQRGTR